MGWISNPGANTGGPDTWQGAQTIAATGKTALAFSDTTTTTGITFGESVNALYRLTSTGLKCDTNLYVGADFFAEHSQPTAVGVGNAGPSGESGLSFQNGESGSKFYRSGSGALASAGTLQPVGGLVAPTAVSVNNYVAGQAPATSTQGTDTTPVSGTIFFGQVFVPANTTLTGISYLIGTVGGTNSVIVGLYNNAGTLVKNSALAGTVVGTLATMQRVPFTATYAAVGPAMYWVSVSMNGTTARLRTHTFGDHAAGSATGVFGTLGNISPVTTFTANTAPYAMTY